MDILGLIIGIIGVVVSVYYGIKSKRLEERIRRFSWDDVSDAIEYIYRHGILGYKPDLILTVSMPGTIVASLVAARKGSYLPFFSSRPYPKRKAPSGGDHVVETTKWTIELPAEIFAHKDMRVLVIDGAVLTGDTLNSVSQYLTNNGFQRSKIKWATLVATDLAIQSGKGPDFYKFRVADPNVYLPWGRVQEPGL